MFITGPRRDQDGHRRGGRLRGARRRDDAQHQVGRRALRLRGRGRLPRGLPLPDLASCRRTTSQTRTDACSRPTTRERMDPELDDGRPGQPEQALRHARRRSRLIVDDGEFLEVHEHHAREHRLRLRAPRRLRRRRRRQPARALAGVLDIDASAKAARFVRTCDAFNIPLDHVRRRPRLPAGHRAGVGRDHPPRRQAALRLRRGDGAEADGDHAQGLRRRLRRDVLQAPARRLQLRLADRRGRGDGPGGRRQHHLPPRHRRQPDAGRAPRAADGGLHGALREPLHRGRARLHRRRDRAARDAPAS